MLMRSENLLGRTVAGYRLLEVLGKGGMSEVFLAQRLDSPENQGRSQWEHVAIKMLLPSDPVTPEEFVSSQARFLREVQAANHLHHEHILPVLGYGVEDGLFYMVMPVISGGTLATRIAAAHGPLPLDKIAGYLNQLASAVDYANAHGMIHRDIKPGNVLIDEQDNVYLVDFGIVHIFDKGIYAIDQAPTTLTAAGKMYGTPAYMAPERFKGEPAEPATDIYALGVLLYQLVTGQVPFKADNPLTLGMKHLTEEPPAARSLRPDLPEPAEKAILKALAKEPADRFATASALAAAFDAGLKGQWVDELFPLPPVVPPQLLQTQVQQPLAPVVPIPEGPYESNQLILGPVPDDDPVAFAPTQVDSLPAVSPAQPMWRGWQMFATAALVIVLLLLSGLAVLGVQLLQSRSTGPGIHAVPTSTHGDPIKGVTATPTVGVTPTSAQTSSPSPVLTSTPMPTPTPHPSPTPTPTPHPSPTATPTPHPSPTPTPRPTPTPTP